MTEVGIFTMPLVINHLGCLEKQTSVLIFALDEMHLSKNICRRISEKKTKNNLLENIVYWMHASILTCLLIVY